MRQIVWLLLALGCASASPETEPESQPPVAESRAGRPVGRSDHPRAGKFTYRLLEVKRSESGVRVDLELRNGTSRDYGSVQVRVVAYGAEGGLRSQQLPVGRVRRGQARRVTARLGPVPFRVSDVGLELIYAVP